MQLSYHRYFFRDTTTGECRRLDARPFLHGYLKWRNAKFKNGFMHGGESLFLLPLAGDVSLFVQAKDNEIIKKIKRSNMSVSELQSVLTRDDSIGFASYVCLGSDYLGIGSTVLAPRISALGHYMNQLFEKLDMKLKFEVEALTYTLPKNEAVKLAHVGTFSIRVLPGNRLRDTIIGSLGLRDRGDFDVGSVTITIRPAAHGGDTKKAFLAALEHAAGDRGLESFDARARVDATDKMTDIYIVGAGGIRDAIKTSDEGAIASAINEAIEGNRILAERIDDFRKDPHVAPTGDPGDLGLVWPPPSLAGLAADGRPS